MARRVFRPDFRGYVEMLRTEPGIRQLIEQGTAAAGAEVRDAVAEYRVSPQYVLDGVVITDRPQGNVTVAVRRAEALEGKYGFLDRAAFNAGFREINQKKG